MEVGRLVSSHDKAEVRCLLMSAGAPNRDGQSFHDGRTSRTSDCNTRGDRSAHPYPRGATPWLVVGRGLEVVAPGNAAVPTAIPGRRSAASPACTTGDAADGQW